MSVLKMLDVIVLDVSIRRHRGAAPDACTAGLDLLDQIGFGVFVVAVFGGDLLEAGADDFLVHGMAGHAAAGLREFFIGCGIAGSA